jgi:hypothetical protein
MFWFRKDKYLGEAETAAFDVPRFRPKRGNSTLRFDVPRFRRFCRN